MKIKLDYFSDIISVPLVDKISMNFLLEMSYPFLTNTI